MEWTHPLCSNCDSNWPGSDARAQCSKTVRNGTHLGNRSAPKNRKKLTGQHYRGPEPIASRKRRQVRKANLNQALTSAISMFYSESIASRCVSFATCDNSHIFPVQKYSFGQTRVHANRLTNESENIASGCETEMPRWSSSDTQRLWSFRTNDPGNRRQTRWFPTSPTFPHQI